ncbi:hypothetical protein HA402_008885 [Bradysia odoriphaga]|nr:hypothetical protein HA402_008885 [Bradysia odoriphaga]
MSSISRENSQNQNSENNSVTKQHLDTVDRDSDSDNGIVDNNITVNQSTNYSSVGTIESDRSECESDESDGEELLSHSNEKRLLFGNMIVYFGREFTVFLILLLTTYATYHNLPPKVSKISPSKPFFPKGSLVNDWPHGQLNLKSKLLLTDLSFVLFYAPWCAESQHARSSYEHVARLFAREAEFSAINCWQPGGECRAHYTKVMTWPVLMAYTQNGLAVPYNGTVE